MCAVIGMAHQLTHELCHVAGYTHTGATEAAECAANMFAAIVVHAYLERGMPLPCCTHLECNGWSQKKDYEIYDQGGPSCSMQDNGACHDTDGANLCETVC
jgi:hypothetical protein